MQGHAILSGQDRLAQRGLGWTAAIIACLSSLALFGLGQPVTAQDSSVRILTPPPVAQMFRIGPNGTPAASATLSTLNSIVREPRGLASSGEVGLDLDIPTRNRQSIRRESRIFRIVSTRPIFIRTGFGSVPRETATMFWSTSAPGVSFQYEYNVPLEFKFICAPIVGACDGRYLLVRSSNYIFPRSINFDLAKR
jgi:hypothetical protein